jgi:hypothetical protein
MPSTYSPDLRIELIATGEQAGTWGTTTNTNLGTLIEDAIAGYVSVSITSANQALTASNGAADQARNMIVNLTTTTSANFNVYVPPANKFYVIRNSSAYQATIFCSTTLGNTTAAGTGVAISASSTTIVFADGTNVVSALNYLPSALPVVSGGTGATTLTANNVLLGNGTSAVQVVAPGTTGNILTSNGTTWTSAAAGGGFPAGTLMLFQQTNAPTGWTKQTTHDNKALRVVSGSASSGGSVNFTTAFASQGVSGTVGSTTLTISQIPSHNHPAANTPDGDGSPAGDSGDYRYGTFPSFPGTVTVASQGGGGSHNHSFSGSAINLAVQYVDLIIASKD